MGFTIQSLYVNVTKEEKFFLVILLKVIYGNCLFKSALKLFFPLESSIIDFIQIII